MQEIVQKYQEKQKGTKGFLGKCIFSVQVESHDALHTHRLQQKKDSFLILLMEDE